MQGVDFTETEAYSRIYKFVLMVDDSIKNVEQKDSSHHVAILMNINRIIDETELSTSPQRYANEAAKIVFRRINEVYDDEYLRNSFGNSIRLDYGTGHELNYLCYLYTQHCQKKLEVNCVFNTLVKYFETVRTFVSKFNLEPAGSHGIWGLDDYQFLPFLLGSSELFSTRLSFDELEEDKCYVTAIKKKLGGAPHTLQNIMDRGWSCINRGMIKMYDDHVLRRNVVTQHFIYSKYLKADKNKDT